MMKTIFFYTIFWIILCGCSDTNSKQNNQAPSPEPIEFTSAFDTVLNDFKTLAKRYRSNGINVVLYIKLIEGKENNEFKIHLECINDQKQLLELPLDHFYFEDQFIICFDSNMNHLFSIKSTIDKIKLLELSKLKNYDILDTKMPSWLVLIRDEKLVKINHAARSLFVLYPKKIIRFGSNDKKMYDIDEWGYLYDENRKIVDSVR